MSEELSEQRLIEKYIQEFSLEDCLDEVLNTVVTERPSNPYRAIAHAIELKTTPEILGVRLRSVYVRGLYIVKVMLDTNAGTFEAHMPYKSPATEVQEYSITEGKLSEALRGINPCELKQVDEIVQGLADIDASESMGVSIACTLVCSKMKDKPLYETLAELSGTRNEDLVIPMPVLTLAIRSLTVHPDVVQSVQVFATKSTSVDAVITKYNRLLSAISAHEKVMKPPRYTMHGTVYIDSASIEDLTKLIISIIRSHSDLSELMVGISFHNHELVKNPEPGNFQYELEGHAHKTGTDIVDNLMALWQEQEIIAVDMPLAIGDLTGLRYLRKRTQEILFEAKNAGGDKLKYCCRGVGGDHACGLQVTIDGSACVPLTEHNTTADGHPGASEFMKHVMECPTNTLRISLTKFRNLSDIFEVVKAGRKGFVTAGNAGAAAAPAALLGTPTPYVPIVSACALHNLPSDVLLDDFVVDLAVGIGATQVHFDGLYALDTSSKIQRLQTIAEETANVAVNRTSKAGVVSTSPPASFKLPFVGAKFHSIHA